MLTVASIERSLRRSNCGDVEKPFTSMRDSELISYRVNFILYRIGDVMGAFVAFYLWKVVFDSSRSLLIQASVWRISPELHHQGVL